MPPKRKSDADTEGRPAKKATTPKLKKSKMPNWTSSHWSPEKPATDWARKCVERWCLLPPYDTSISEELWEKYYQEREALDGVNTPNSDASKPIVSEELGQDTFRILSAASTNVSAAIYGSVLDEDTRRAIARTIRGSLYFLDLWGNDEEGGGDNPRTVNAKTRLYSPFGLGTSVDLSYNFHWRQFRAGERFSDLSKMSVQRSSKLIYSLVKLPFLAILILATPANRHVVKRQSRTKSVGASLLMVQFRSLIWCGLVLHFVLARLNRELQNNSKIKGTTAKNVASFEETLFGCQEWLSPLKSYNLLIAAGTVLHYKENNAGTVKKAGGDKFKFFQDESKGKNLVEGDMSRIVDMDATLGIPQRMLLLGREEGDGNKSNDAE
ncbi:hypothetical protein FISHEDRAFT_55304 [Fistulina hepatica ATCC 64428]|uniref:Uncharacterized protein n=1 Tax=Fistulina hepatica ATCC 64428 TaxID=1128425 RepID=A0A0D7API7_9AGAR|nr:hypothetical protein FISHEDRAFT_55304 [Fistulina hepatica ATCC 64428]